ncbi:hypothetical protein [Lacticaseibacillus sharpeae]|uniref:hypothetical protein n=1 Tax=Lacticaseibacillus sharpeae TaxID=1626 RepID=UPI0006D124E1|nr:hypothetical protein [Lacticaseibacillus sharpeae]
MTTWVKFIQAHFVVEGLEESVGEMEFEYGVWPPARNGGYLCTKKGGCSRPVTELLTIKIAEF